MGEVFEIEEISTRKHYAVKKIFDLARFRRVEIDAPRLHLPFNADIREVFLEKNRVLQIIQSFYEGGSGFDLSADHLGGLDIKQARQLGAQLAYGLWALHRQGVIHRDIKL